MSHPRTSRRALAAASRTALALTGAAAFALVGSGVAFAHVVVTPDTGDKGGYATVAFRVPNESATAGTVKVEVTLPTDHPVISARTTPIPGWTAQVVKAPLPAPVDDHGAKVTESVKTITWTAQPGTKIGQDQYVDFQTLLRLPSDGDQLSFPAAQTYDDGSVVRWDQAQAPGAEEPEHPAPTLTLVDDPDGGGGHGHDAAAMTAGTTQSHDAGASATDGTARWLGGAGLLLGALGAGLGVGAVLRTRRSS
jgi:periplasmic copper chaperone A